MSTALIDRVKNARDRLVHEGRFVDERTPGMYSSYICLLWTDLAAICRLTGYKGMLPELADALKRLASRNKLATMMLYPQDFALHNKIS